ncbi:MAG: Gfo/Idh/MocA family oxidoreductase [Planctomycetota bacterium]|nr:MAG: Gfo/Idh/MocA family oxidoreductase [Planctomycetota bacterium]
MSSLPPRSARAASRRDFLKASAGSAGLLAAPAFAARAARTAGADRIRVGLIGCGGRGTGAAVNAVEAAEGVEIVALGDVFQDRVNDCRRNLLQEIPEACKFSDDTCFAGFDSYRKVLDAGVDLVILASAPGFRPVHFQAAIEGGKHVFMEKPVATDAPGVRAVIAAAELAEQKKLGVVAGTQRRHQLPYLEAMKRIHDGAIGEIVGGQCYWNQGGLWHMNRKPEWSDMEYQIRNWLYFTWLSGDHIVEQHVHNLDVMNWALRSHPVKAMGVGGRAARVQAEFGHIYDHFAIEFEYPGGARVLSMCRQQDGTPGRVGERVQGTKGVSDPSGSISGANPWHFEGDAPNPYVQEHADLIASIRAGKPLNEGRQIAESTLTAIMGRMAAYTGQEVTWDFALNSREQLVPKELKFGPLPAPEVAVPGRTKLV